ncbi:hypothetical protein [Devosia sp. UYZn731]|uniref:hypothetical protein n=1 Tax=Devosia sp. UYZn731 TaxID=3156345 RepID=UPI003396FF40
MTTVLSMVLGLGVTRLLLGVVTVFRIRNKAAVDWLPLGWAVCLFMQQLEYWWAINQLPMIKSTFSFTDFVSLVILTMTLFVASALLLPSRTEDEAVDLRSYFETEGRYGLLAMSVFSLLAFLTNVFFFNAAPFAPWSVLDASLIVLPAIAFFAGPRRLQVGMFCIYLPVLALDIWISAGA